MIAGLCIFRRIAFIILMFLPYASIAKGFDLGVGLSSATDGRATPALYGALPMKSWVISGTSAGMQSEVYYENNYTASVMYSTSVSDTMFGKPELGFGAGVHYAVRELVGGSEDGTSSQRSSDANLGPAFRLILRPFGPVFFGFDFVLGLGVGLFSGGVADAGAFVVGVRI